MTPNKNQNPGFATFEIDDSSLIPKNLKMIFVDLEQTYGWQSVPNDINGLPLLTVDFHSQFGL